MCDIVSSSGKSAGSVETIIHEHLLLKKVCAWWVSKMLTFNQKVQHVAVSAAKHLHLFVLEVKMFLE
jgi:hypothetical protein